MENEWIPVFSDAVKIGLGAVIGGAFGIFTIRLNNSNTRRSEYIQKRREVCEQVLTPFNSTRYRVSLYIAYRQSALSRQNLHERMTDEELVSLVGQATDLYMSFEDLQAAQSRLRLIGELAAEKALKEFRHKASEVYNYAYSWQLEEVTSTKLTELSSELDSLRDIFLDELNKVFDHYIESPSTVQKGRF